jgi:sister-chromatid-cohesion protein PDS5
MQHSENKDSAAILQFAWIPHELFQMIKVTSEVRCVLPFSPRALADLRCSFRPLVEDVVAEFILPLPSASSAPSTSKSASANTGEVDEGVWTDRLLTVMVFLDDEHSMNTLLAFSGVQRACIIVP